MKRIYLLLLPALLACLGSTAAAALSPVFSYQGRLSDQGSPAEGLYDLRFELFDTETGANPAGAVPGRTEESPARASSASRWTAAAAPQPRCPAG